MKMRGLSQSGHAAECMAKATHHRSAPVAAQPPVAEQLGSPMDKVPEVTEALDDMIFWLVVDQIDGESHCSELEKKTRVFLTLFAEMDDKLTRKNALPVWLMMACKFPSLLNLPNVARLRGPPRNIVRVLGWGKAFFASSNQL